MTCDLVWREDLERRENRTRLHKDFLTEAAFALQQDWLSANRTSRTSCRGTGEQQLHHSGKFEYPQRIAFFGFSANGFAHENSGLDASFECSVVPLEEATRLEALRQELLDYPELYRKCRIQGNTLHCRMMFNGGRSIPLRVRINETLQVQVARLMRPFSANPYCQALATILNGFVRENNLASGGSIDEDEDDYSSMTEVDKGLLPAHGYLLMLIFFLQKIAVLPWKISSKSTETEKNGITEGLSLVRLWLGFLEFYGASRHNRVPLNQQVRQALSSREATRAQLVEQTREVFGRGVECGGLVHSFAASGGDPLLSSCQGDSLQGYIKQGAKTRTFSSASSSVGGLSSVADQNHIDSSSTRLQRGGVFKFVPQWDVLDYVVGSGQCKQQTSSSAFFSQDSSEEKRFPVLAVSQTFLGDERSDRNNHQEYHVQHSSDRDVLVEDPSSILHMSVEGQLVFDYVIRKEYKRCYRRLQQDEVTAREIMEARLQESPATHLPRHLRRVQPPPVPEQHSFQVEDSSKNLNSCPPLVQLQMEPRDLNVPRIQPPPGLSLEEAEPSMTAAPRGRLVEEDENLNLTTPRKSQLSKARTPETLRDDSREFLSRKQQPEKAAEMQMRDHYSSFSAFCPRSRYDNVNICNAAPSFSAAASRRSCSRTRRPARTNGRSMTPPGLSSAVLSGANSIFSNRSGSTRTSAQRNRASRQVDSYRNGEGTRNATITTVTSKGQGVAAKQGRKGKDGRKPGCENDCNVGKGWESTSYIGPGSMGSRDYEQDFDMNWRNERGSARFDAAEDYNDYGSRSRPAESYCTTANHDSDHYGVRPLPPFASLSTIYDDLCWKTSTATNSTGGLYGTSKSGKNQNGNSTTSISSKNLKLNMKGPPTTPPSPPPPRPPSSHPLPHWDPFGENFEQQKNGGRDDHLYYPPTREWEADMIDDNFHQDGPPRNGNYYDKYHLTPSDSRSSASASGVRSGGRALRENNQDYNHNFYTGDSHAGGRNDRPRNDRFYGEDEHQVDSRKPTFREERVHERFLHGGHHSAPAFDNYRHGSSASWSSACVDNGERHEHHHNLPSDPPVEPFITTRSGGKGHSKSIDSCCSSSITRAGALDRTSVRRPGGGEYYHGEEKQEKAQGREQQHYQQSAHHTPEQTTPHRSPHLHPTELCHQSPLQQPLQQPTNGNTKNYKGDGGSSSTNSPQMISGKKGPLLEALQGQGKGSQQQTKNTDSTAGASMDTATTAVSSSRNTPACSGTSSTPEQQQTTHKVKDTNKHTNNSKQMSNYRDGKRIPRGRPFQGEKKAEKPVFLPDANGEKRAWTVDGRLVSWPVERSAAPGGDLHFWRRKLFQLLPKQFARQFKAPSIMEKISWPDSFAKWNNSLLSCLGAPKKRGQGPGGPRVFGLHGGDQVHNAYGDQTDNCSTPKNSHEGEVDPRSSSSCTPKIINDTSTSSDQQGQQQQQPSGSSKGHQPSAGGFFSPISALLRGETTFFGTTAAPASSTTDVSARSNSMSTTVQEVDTTSSTTTATATSSMQEVDNSSTTAGAATTSSSLSHHQLNNLRFKINPNYFPEVNTPDLLDTGSNSSWTHPMSKSLLAARREDFLAERRRVDRSDEANLGEMEITNQDFRSWVTEWDFHVLWLIAYGVLHGVTDRGITEPMTILSQAYAHRSNYKGQLLGKLVENGLMPLYLSAPATCDSWSKYLQHFPEFFLIRQQASNNATIIFLQPGSGKYQGR
ncbi:unnamed protein product [Amoebophrya sp. A25]|nr:unnamed protein product [Amoebophrya sp. A25]|eukprot:GSA25T00006798001.1